MIEFPANESGHTVSHVRKERALGTALAELALTFSLVFSILVVLGATSAMAAARSDLIMMDEAGTTFTTFGIVAVIAVVMGFLTILALRDVAPAHSKRTSRRTTTTTTTTVSRR